MEVLENNPTMKKALEDGFDFNGDVNGEWMKRYSSVDRFNETNDLIASSKGVHASHPEYNKKINELIMEIDPNLNSVQTAEAVKEITNSVKELIKANPEIKINDLLNQL